MIVNKIFTNLTKYNFIIMIYYLNYKINVVIRKSKIRFTYNLNKNESRRIEFDLVE